MGANDWNLIDIFVVAFFAPLAVLAGASFAVLFSEHVLMLVSKWRAKKDKAIAERSSHPGSYVQLPKKIVKVK